MPAPRPRACEDRARLTRPQALLHRVADGGKGPGAQNAAAKRAGGVGEDFVGAGKGGDDRLSMRRGWRRDAACLTHGCATSISKPARRHWVATAASIVSIGMMRKSAEVSGPDFVNKTSIYCRMRALLPHAKVAFEDCAKHTAGRPAALIRASPRLIRKGRSIGRRQNASRDAFLRRSFRPRYATVGVGAILHQTICQVRWVPEPHPDTRAEGGKLARRRNLLYDYCCSVDVI
jgi:hypothetical protein